jgi:hypothetical protein
MLQAMQLALIAESLCYTRASVRPSDCTPEGQVAQLVEHRTENAGVAGSIPALATSLRSLEASSGPEALSLASNAGRGGWFPFLRRIIVHPPKQ